MISERYAGRLANHGQCTNSDRLDGAAAGIIAAAAHHDNRCRAALHDLARSVVAIQDWQMNVHGDHVWP
jgi:hypothetical protein